MYIVVHLSVTHSVYFICRILHLKGSGVAGLKTCFSLQTRSLQHFGGHLLAVKIFDLLGLSFRLMVIHAELHGYRKRWAAPSNRAEVPAGIGSPAEVVESEPGQASEGHRSEEDRFSVNAEFQSSASTGDSERLFPSQMSTQQTGIVTALFHCLLMQQSGGVLFVHLTMSKMMS